MLTPRYPTGGAHNDIYFLVYEPLTAAQPGKVGLYLVATFDLAGIVPGDKYYVPTSCGQCHGTEVRNQVGGKINYLDTDHFIDRTGDDFGLVEEADVLVDPAPQAYDAIRILNAEIAQQNRAVTGSGRPFALLAAQEWLQLHRPGRPYANRHVPAIRRGFANQPGEPVWTPGAAPDEALLPLLNRHCFRCHSSVRFHVFDKRAVTDRKRSIPSFVDSGYRPQGRVLDQTTKDRIRALIGQLP